MYIYINYKKKLYSILINNNWFSGFNKWILGFKDSDRLLRLKCVASWHLINSVFLFLHVFSISAAPDLTLHLSECSIPSYLCVRHQTHSAYSSNSDKLYWTPVPHSHRYYARSGVTAPLYFRIILTPQMAQLGAGSPGFGGVGLCSSLFYALSPPSRERLLRLPSTFPPHTAVKLTIKDDRLQKRKGTSVHMALSRFWIYGLWGRRHATQGEPRCFSRLNHPSQKREKCAQLRDFACKYPLRCLCSCRLCAQSVHRLILIIIPISDIHQD